VLDPGAVPTHRRAARDPGWSVGASSATPRPRARRGRAGALAGGHFYYFTHRKGDSADGAQIAPLLWDLHLWNRALR